MTKNDVESRIRGIFFLALGAIPVIIESAEAEIFTIDLQRLLQRK